MRPLKIIIVGLFVCSCAHIRIGGTSARAGDADSADIIIKVVRITLDPLEAGCPIELRNPGTPIESASGVIKQVATVNVCGHTEKYRIWRYRSDVPGWVDVEARRI
jgi:hypothetical protein